MSNTFNDYDNNYGNEDEWKFDKKFPPVFYILIAVCISVVTIYLVSVFSNKESAQAPEVSQSETQTSETTDNIEEDDYFIPEPVTEETTVVFVPNTTTQKNTYSRNSNDSKITIKSKDSKTNNTTTAPKSEIVAHADSSENKGTDPTVNGIDY